VVVVDVQLRKGIMHIKVSHKAGVRIPDAAVGTPPDCVPPRSTAAPKVQRK